MSKYNIGEVVFRHGDVLLRKTDKQNGHNSPIVSQAVLHAGQNHNHTMTGEFRMFEEDGKKYVEILGPTTLGHNEHGSLSLKRRKTALEVGIQVEYDHWLEESRQVID